MPASQQPALINTPIAASWQGLSSRDMPCTARCSCITVRWGFDTTCCTTSRSSASRAPSPEPWKTAGVTAAADVVCVAAEVLTRSLPLPWPSSLLLSAATSLRLPAAAEAHVLLLLLPLLLLCLRFALFTTIPWPRRLLLVTAPCWCCRGPSAAVLILPVLTAAMLPRSFGAYTPFSTSCCHANRASLKLGSAGGLTLLFHLGQDDVEEQKRVLSAALCVDDVFKPRPQVAP